MSHTTAQTLGEITVRGNVVMKGYYNDPEATSAAIKNNWFHSGDAAVVHPDGYVEIRDHFKDIIISGGENISSVEIEGCLLRASRGAGGRRGRHAASSAGGSHRTLSSSCRQGAQAPRKI